MSVPENIGFKGDPSRLPLAQRRSIMRGIGEVAVDVSKGRLRIATHEEDLSRQDQKEAASFLKLDEKRLGRDFEQYAFLAEVIGWQSVLPMILGEVINPLETAKLPESHMRASRRLRAIGDEVYTGDLKGKWDALFDESSDTK